MMQKTVYIYDNNRARNGLRVSKFLKKSTEGGDCEEVTVEIPDDLEPYETELGETMVKLGAYHYSLDECLRIDKNDILYLKSMEPGQAARRLKIVIRNGRKSLAFCL